MLQFRSVDKAGNVEQAQSLAFKIDATRPVISGMPGAECTIWPPNNKMVRIAAVTAADNGSGVAPGSLSVMAASSEPVAASDIVVTGGIVEVRASRSGEGTGRVYTVTSQVADVAGNSTAVVATCTVPHDQSK